MADGSSKTSSKTPVYDRFVGDIAVLKCVLAALESLEGDSTDRDDNLASAGLSLRNCVVRLEKLCGPIDVLEHQARRNVTERVRRELENAGREGVAS